MRETDWFKIRNLLLVAAACLSLGVALWLYVLFGYGTPVVIVSDSMEAHPDFDVFWHSAKALWDGRNIYFETGGPDNSNNPPFWTMLISPLGLLEPLTAYRAFVLVMLLTSVSYLAWMANELRLRAVWAVVGVGMLLLSAPLLSTLANGQMYPIVTLGLVATWIADRKGRFLISGCILGLILAVKPLLVPIALWPLVRRRWNILGATLVSGATATLFSLLVTGPMAMFDWLRVLDSERLNGFWDNASLHGAAARLFRENDFVEPITTLQWTEPAAYVFGVGVVILTAAKVRRGSEMGLWALVAASLLASPVAWHSYLVLLGPGVLLLLARGWVAPALLLLALQFIPPEWSVPWRYGDTAAAALALTLNLYILTTHWFVFLLASGDKKERPPQMEITPEETSPPNTATVERTSNEYREKNASDYSA